MIPRQEYIDLLNRFRDKQLIKVVTGIRRCGKSTLFELYIAYLKSDGVTDGQIINVNFEDGDHNTIETSKQLYDYVKDRLLPGKRRGVLSGSLHRH